MATSDQKFLLLVGKDEFFKKECDFMIKKWNLDDIKTNDIFFTFKYASGLPVNYKGDIEFILWQSKLPRRYLWSLHRYLISRIIPKPKELPQKARIVYSLPATGIESCSAEIDADASREDIKSILREFTKMKKVIQESYGLEKSQQPIQNIKEAKTIIGSKPSDIGDMADKPNQDFRKAKNRLDVKQYRYRKKFSEENKVPVSRRGEYEKYRDNIDPGF